MKKYFLYGLQVGLFLSIFLALNLHAQTAPVKLWDKTIGGNFNDAPRTLQKTSDGGFILSGVSESSVGGDKTQAPKGGKDFWIVKLDSSGNKLWDKTFGGTNDEDGPNIQETIDGGYILSGSTISGIGGDKTHPSEGASDFWILKLDSSGNKLWDKTFGGNNVDLFPIIHQTTDGGFILGGTSNSGISGQKSQASKGYNDFWILKLDSNGNKIWDKVLGGSLIEELYWLQQTADGGYVLGGLSNSGISGDKSQSCIGASDYWIIKVNANGIKMWDRTYGGTSADRLTCLQQTSDGGFLLGGTVSSQMGGNIGHPSRGLNDYWVLKVDASGNKIWDKRFGGSQYEELKIVKQTPDGGFILGGYSDSGISGDKTQPNKGIYDYWLVKIDSTGNKQWDKDIGGRTEDIFATLEPTSDGGYVLVGGSNSVISGDKSQASKGGYDLWVVKLIPDCSILSATLIPSCNNGLTTLNVNVTGAQLGGNGLPSWRLTYSVNGSIQTYSGTTPTFTLVQNGSPGTAFALIRIVSGICIKNLSDTFTIHPIPTAPLTNSVSRCSGDSVTLSATGGALGGSYVWYDVPMGGTALQSSLSGTFIAPPLSTTTTYYVASTNNAGCESARTPVVVTINNPTVTCLVAEDVQPFCVTV